MSRQVLINLPVKNLDRSKEFFLSLGFAINPELTDENATCFVVDKNIMIALLKEPYFEAITKTKVADTTKVHEAYAAISMESKEEVDTLTDKAVVAGGRELHEPKDFGWIYGRTFADLDGHHWNIFYMDLDKMPK